MSVDGGMDALEAFLGFQEMLPNERAHGGLPGVVMGPGSIAQAHTAREFVPTREVETMADFFEALLEGRNV